MASGFGCDPPWPGFTVRSRPGPLLQKQVLGWVFARLRRPLRRHPRPHPLPPAGDGVRHAAFRHACAAQQSLQLHATTPIHYGPQVALCVKSTLSKQLPPARMPYGFHDGVAPVFSRKRPLNNSQPTQDSRALDGDAEQRPSRTGRVAWAPLPVLQRVDRT